MNDWNVVLWYQHSHMGQKMRHPGIREEELFIVGTVGRRADVEGFGKRLVEFLIGAGNRVAAGEGQL